MINSFITGAWHCSVTRLFIRALPISVTILLLPGGLFKGTQRVPTLTLDVTYQTRGNPPAIIDSAMWMRNGVVNTGRMMEKLMLCKDSQQYIIYHAPPGSTLRVKLPDDSEVEMNIDSKLRVPCDFGQESREVELMGEAHFKVRPDSRKVFTVHAGNTDVTAVGTSFNVNSYTNNDYSQVAVTSGKVLVIFKESPANPYTKKVLLSADTCATFIRKTTAITVGKFKTNEIMSWQQGVYACNGQILEEICRTAERAFNTSIQIDNPTLRKKVFFFTFEKSKKISTFLRLLRKNDRNIRYQWDDKGKLHIR